ncbi:hypothetical protein [Pseudoalteromonas sp. PPB1]|uniref:hypothetical protein n=1 Tax=Pseudoalteromonas sp. PPB1 TaxID=2756136 RepID=UPI001E65CE94|nr:hypothetical protein [Pseudoalteromonas sp. PPB1]
MITCFIEYRIDPGKLDLFEQYARNWGEIIRDVVVNWLAILRLMRALILLLMA